MQMKKESMMPPKFKMGKNRIAKSGKGYKIKTKTCKR